MPAAFLNLKFWEGLLRAIRRTGTVKKNMKNSGIRKGRDRIVFRDDPEEPGDPERDGSFACFFWPALF